LPGILPPEEEKEQLGFKPAFLAGIVIGFPLKISIE
jgi:hypothetical protein